ncbi:MAG: non-hydrolyzing UDP-N-acetylglucosamine 2-epimerase [Pseudobdellovibrionaceae bacterium]
MKIVTILGARPQFIKASALSRELALHPGIEEVIVHTGQHFDPKMSEIFFQEMDIPKPKYNLGIHSLTHGSMTGRMLEKLEQILLEEKPDWVLVYGDTNSTLAGALAAAKLHIPVAHVESGLRSFDMKMPEEINRILTDQISKILFCPTVVAIENLVKEGFEHRPVSIVETGDIMYDSALYYMEKMTFPMGLKEALTKKNFALCTIHRAENTDNPDRLKEILLGLESIAKQVDIVMPLHPRTKGLLQNCPDINLRPFILIEPVGYLEMLALLNACSIVLTDSGGLQKEAYFFKKPCVTLRDQTEWTELVDAGCNILAGTNSKDIIFAFESMQNKKIDFDRFFYGDGKAAKKIVSTLYQLQ